MKIRDAAQAEYGAKTKKRRGPRPTFYRIAELRYVKVDHVDGSVPDQPLMGPDSARAALTALYADRTVEFLGAVAMSARGCAVGHVLLGKGGDALAYMSPTELVRFLALSGATSFFLFHNHPSGTLEWSAEDRAVTRQAGTIGRLIGVKLVDHLLLIPGGEWLSMASTHPDCLGQEVDL